MKTLDQQMRDVLLQINQGRFKFTSDSDDLEDIQNFQTVAQALIAANDLGHIVARFQKSRNRNSYGLITRIEILGPLTYRGIAFLDSMQVEPSSKKASALILEPNVYGIGFRFPVIWNKIRSLVDRLRD